MKKYLLLILTLLLCSSLFTACNLANSKMFPISEEETEKISNITDVSTATPTDDLTETPTEEPTEEPKPTTIDLSMLDQIEIGMERSAVRKMLKVPYEKMQGENSDRYFLSDGRPVYITYTPSFGTVQRIRIDELVDPALVYSLTEEMSYEEVIELFKAEGAVVPTGMFSVEFILTDGRTAHIYFLRRPNSGDPTYYVSVNWIKIDEELINH